MKKYKLRLLIYSFSFLFIFGVLGVSCLGTVKQIHQNKVEKEELQSKYEMLRNQEDDLSLEVEKLQDPEYAAKYARVKYLYTKDGELIIDIKD